ncbi:uncharacterized protein [Penaeus vannamei]|uniref:uncharacterized protein n=1 Tax=Penaeus vannamei TaxID=6689 RepID=UPI00387F5213
MIWTSKDIERRQKGVRRGLERSCLQECATGLSDIPFRPSAMAVCRSWTSRRVLHSCLIWVAMASVHFAKANIDSSCRDMHAACNSWTKQGECITNRDFMLPQCRRSCNYCNEGSSATELTGRESWPAKETELIAPDQIKDGRSSSPKMMGGDSLHARVKRTIMFGGGRGGRSGHRGGMTHGSWGTSSRGNRGRGRSRTYMMRGGGRRGRRQRGRSGCDFLSRIFGRCGGSGRGRRGRGRRRGRQRASRTRSSHGRRQSFWPVQNLLQSLWPGRQSNSVW